MVHVTFIESFRGSIIAHWKYVFVISNGLFHRTSFYFLVWEILLIEALQVFAAIRLHIPWVSTNIFSFIKLLHNKIHISMKISLRYLSYYITTPYINENISLISKMGFSQNFIASWFGRYCQLKLLGIWHKKTTCTLSFSRYFFTP